MVVGKGVETIPYRFHSCVSVSIPKKCIDLRIHISERKYVPPQQVNGEVLVDHITTTGKLSETQSFCHTEAKSMSENTKAKSTSRKFKIV